MLRRVGVAVGLTACAAVAVSLPSAGAAAQTGGDTVTADSDGWWSQTDVGVATPDGAITPPLPRSPLIPAGSLPVSATLGQPQTDAAIGITVPEGMQATKLVMTLALVDANGAESNPSQAKLQACPITSFWGGTDGGKWADRPEADCTKAAAEGSRNEDGSWTFDLTPIAALWSDEFEAVGQNGVLITESAGPPATFQIAFAGAPDGVTFDAELTEESSGAGAFDVPVASGGSLSGGGSFDTSPSFDASPLPAPLVGGSGAPVSTPTATPPRQGAVSQLAADRAGGDLTGGLPPGLLLLVPLALVLAVLASRSLSPVAPRAERVRRQGGISRVLAARTARNVRRSRPELP